MEAAEGFCLITDNNSGLTQRADCFDMGCGENDSQKSPISKSVGMTRAEAQLTTKRWRLFSKRWKMTYRVLFIFASCCGFQTELWLISKTVWFHGKTAPPPAPHLPKEKIHTGLLASIHNLFFKLSWAFVVYINVQNTCGVFVHKHMEILTLVAACLLISLFLKIVLKKLNKNWNGHSWLVENKVSLEKL